MTTVIRTDSDNTDFIQLVQQLDAYLAIQDGDEHDFYHQFNKTANLNNVVVIYSDNKPAACGAIKEIAIDTMEVKRMYTTPDHRRKGIATLILKELETWAKELGYTKCVLETGKRQPEAISLYERSGYKHIPNYGQYIGVENSICFEKELT